MHTLYAPEGRQVQYVIVQGFTEECCDKIQVWIVKLFIFVLHLSLILIHLSSFQVLSDGVSLGYVSGNVTEEKSFLSSNGALTVIFESDYSQQYQGYEGYFLIAS